MLKSAHVALVPLTVDDLPAMFGWINEREEVLLNAPYKPVHEGQQGRRRQEVHRETARPRTDGNRQQQAAYRR